ncbi:hypothetical protein M3Y97_00430000 [Aphelenchoides bicaudatus]|nr:hypothetical protein M3Y97_00430000 [Aphelenchoides bicaudatus]
MSTDDHPGAGKFNPNSDRMVYITNLNFNMEWGALKDEIKQVAEVSFVEILKNRDGKSKGVAVVELVTREGAKACIETIHRKEVGGRTLSVKEIRDPAAFFRKIKDETGVDFLSRDGERRAAPRERRPSPGLPLAYETYGLSNSFLENLGLRPPLVNRVFVTNIPFNVQCGKLYDVFSLAGKITYFDLQLDADGKSRGMALIEFSHPLEAVQAVSMLHNQRLLDRTLTVKMDRFEKESDKDRFGLPRGLRQVGMGLGANGTPLKDIAAVVGQIQPQPLISQYPTNGLGSAVSSLGQQNQPSFTSYQAQQQQPIQQTHVYEQSSYPQQTAAPAYSQQVVAPRQATPPPSNGGYYATQSYGTTEQSYGSNQSPYVKQELNSSRGSYGSAPIAASRQSYGSYSNEQIPSRVILIKNLPEDYTWSVIAQRIRQFGEFEAVDLVGAGTAKVRFLHVDSAEKARKALNNTIVEKNLINVEYII